MFTYADWMDCQQYCRFYQTALAAARLFSKLPKQLTTSDASNHHLKKPHFVGHDLMVSTFRALLNLTAVVTGGHRGLGAAISEALGAAGANVLVIDRSGVGESKIPDTLKRSGVRHWSVCAELADSASVLTAAAEVRRLVPDSRVDILVNNAGVALLNTLDELDVQQLDTTYAVNVRAPIMLAQALKPRTIVNVSSVASSRALNEHAAYCASKAAIDMITRVMALEWGPRGVRANAVAPTVVMTEMGRRVWSSPEKGGPMLARIPQGRFAEPEDVARAVVYLASDAADMINGQVLPVDGGFTVT